MLNFLCYIIIALWAMSYSTITWNRATAAGGEKQNEPQAAQVVFGILTAGAIFAFKHIFNL